MNLKFAAGVFLGFALMARATPELVTNGGFETGDFTGWSIAAATCGSDFGVSTNPADANLGNDAAFFAGTCVGSYDSIMQSLATTPGDDYAVTFLVNIVNNKNASQDFQALWNGNVIEDLPGIGTGVYTEFMFTEPATSSSTPIQFQGFNQPGTDFLDDVSVTDLGASTVPEPSTTLLLCAGIGLILVRHFRLRRA